MQHPVPLILHRRRGLASAAASVAVVLGVALLTVIGCGEAAIPQNLLKPFDGKKLTLSCPDAAFADALGPMVKAWAKRSGAEVVVRREPMTPEDESDIGLIPAGQLGRWGEPGLLVPVPPKLRANDNPFQWFGLLSAYGERLVEWGGQTLAVPLTGDGSVIVYRADRLTDTAVAAEYHKLSPNATAPATWEEFAALAAAFAAVDKKPSLPPLPTDPERMFDLFGRVAASIDREKLDDVQLASRTDRDAIAFYFSVTTGKPRLTSDGFLEAAKWFAGLQKSKALPADGPDDPVAALADGRAMLAVLSLDQLVRLPRESGAVPARFGLVGVPGARTFRHADDGKIRQDVNRNFVPYYAGGRLGVVRTRCQNAEAAFDLLADLGGPARSAEFVGTPGLGAGPTRVAHLDRERLTLWLGYGFDEERSKALQDAMRHYVEQTVKNPAQGLRGPDRTDLIAAAGSALRKLGTGVSPTDALTEAEKAWLALDAKVPPDTLIRWRQRAVGLN
ncbi:hypothetical protein FTUN_3297 [Frigoriglobus tundricola]|uniref:Uncharacterized protein n=1 Tax=Frigoriglobus tundricola TaxID=2774151 RepID=A0A6M5YR23_9BACT|nr:hypothetical protein FTUN_3297 [Frigoriglobus tundricola]